MKYPTRRQLRGCVLVLQNALCFGVVVTTTTLFAADAAIFSTALESISVADLRKHVHVLASDTLEGREAGSRGGKAAGVYLVQQLKKLGIKPAGSENSFSQFFGFDYRNILGLLPGSDPVLKKEYVIVCAHYDHVGYGNRTNSFGPYGSIHNGADDNASGTSGLLELIEAMITVEPRPRRSLLFIFWDAEEKGLLGSEHWVESPTVDIGMVKLAFNLDMIGRLRNQSVTVFGSRTAAGLRRLLAEQNTANDLLLNFNRTIKRDSDHYSFIQSRIPAVMLHTGKHSDYHRPSDDSDKLNLTGMQQLTRLLFLTAYTAANSPNLNSFRQASRRESGEAERRFAGPSSQNPRRLGIVWDGPKEEKGVVRISEIDPDSPADRAGLKVGDRILEFANYRIDGRHDFGTVVLAAAKESQIVVQRKGEKQPQTIAVKLNGQPQRVGISWHVDDAEPGCVILTQVVSGSPAAMAGLKSGDRVYAVNGRNFKTSEEFLGLVTADEMRLRLSAERQGRIRTAELTLLPKVK
jgi:hypothetical protein